MNLFQMPTLRGCKNQRGSLLWLLFIQLFDEFVNEKEEIERCFLAVFVMQIFLWVFQKWLHEHLNEIVLWQLGSNVFYVRILDLIVKGRKHLGCLYRNDVNVLKEACVTIRIKRGTCQDNACFFLGMGLAKLFNESQR
jgi:hypothetical protein